jgi:hypothetical protein
MTAQGIGAALSTTLAGVVVVYAGYSAAFLTLAGVALIGALVFFFGMPETYVHPSEESGGLRSEKLARVSAAALHPIA